MASIPCIRVMVAQKKRRVGSSWFWIPRRMAREPSANDWRLTEAFQHM